MKTTNQIKRIDKVPAKSKSAIIKTIEGEIKEHGLDITRLVVQHFFKTYRETTQRKKKIAELQKEIQALEKKG